MHVILVNDAYKPNTNLKKQNFFIKLVVVELKITFLHDCKQYRKKHCVLFSVYCKAVRRLRGRNAPVNTAPVPQVH